MSKSNVATHSSEPKVENILRADRLYLGDNGRCFCRDHAGMTAAMTGFDLSGREVFEMTFETAKENGLACEDCKYIRQLESQDRQKEYKLTILGRPFFLSKEAVDSLHDQIHALTGHRPAGR
jgi:hypothetical protein